MEKPTYEKPALLSHTAIKFETLVSGTSSGSGGSFPGLGHGVDGVPANERGDFPNGTFPGKGPTHDHRP